MNDQAMDEVELLKKRRNDLLDQLEICQRQGKNDTDLKRQLWQNDLLIMKAERPESCA